MPPSMDTEAGSLTCEPPKLDCHGSFRHLQGSRLGAKFDAGHSWLRRGYGVAGIPTEAAAIGHQLRCRRAWSVQAVSPSCA